MRELEVRREMQDEIDRALSGRAGIHALEAGCGSCTYVRFPAGTRVTGVDISAEQLQRHPGLTERVVADLQAWSPPADFDVVVCWDVLEHLGDPGAALERLADALAPGGLLVLKAPELWSMKGLFTRATPHRVHVAAYRHLLDYPLAGVDGRGPFPTPLKRAMSRSAVLRFARARGLEVALDRRYDASQGTWLASKRVVGGAYKAAYRTARVASAGALAPSEYLIVLRRPAAP